MQITAIIAERSNDGVHLFDQFLQLFTALRHVLPDGKAHPDAIALGDVAGFLADNREQIGETVNVAMEALPEELRTAIVLREIEGLSYEEIAAIMECPIGTVRSRIFRAREAISEKLKPLLDTAPNKRW